MPACTTDDLSVPNRQVPTAIIIEPDSLPNLATNLKNPHCANTATNAAYTKGIQYAVKTLATEAPNAALYLDAAHGGWLGWDDNAQVARPHDPSARHPAAHHSRAGAPAPIAHSAPARSLLAAPAPTTLTALQRVWPDPPPPLVRP